MKTRKSSEYIHIALPQQVKETSSSEIATREKTSLYIPTTIRDNLPFQPSKHFSNVFVSYGITAVLRAISFYGKFGYRFDGTHGKGIEHDITKQQPIVYTVVVNGEYILLYRRADKKDAPKNQLSLLGDERMQGKLSIGFGGHTTSEDKGMLTTLGILFPGIHPEIQTIAALDQAITTEWQEELGIGEGDIDKFHILGSFYERFSEDVLQRNINDIPVEAFHIGIFAIAELDNRRLGLRGLYLPKSEIHDALWIPVKEIEKTITNFERRGAKIDPWTKYVIAEFLPLVYPGMKGKKYTVNKEQKTLTSHQ